MLFNGFQDIINKHCLSTKDIHMLNSKTALLKNITNLYLASDYDYDLEVIFCTL